MVSVIEGNGVNRGSCPICKGKGALPEPMNANETNEITNKVAAHLLREEGYSIREIMRFLGYKSPRSVAILLEQKP